MKIVIRILLVLTVLNFGVGFYLQLQEHPKGDMVVGIGVLFMGFILLPLFLYHSYKGKKITDYTLDNTKINKIFDNLKW